MYLKALELHGFKSFPEKTRLTFDKPVTAIVGPNGSGKSNIADALQWVMGEQSTKALRGGKMEDVIFGGTEKRAQVGFAEVTLVLDNADGGLGIETDEVEVTRRYYRSGESEYYINRKNVRLRDVNELFMDTGLGRDGYSIIGQGKIDSILSAKSTDRREIFEEAAGISRFRHRKEESERKLQRAEDDLVRVNDKISELELQVEPLRKQSETAKKYLVLRDELRGLEISLWVRDLDEIAERNKRLREESIASAGALEKAKGELEALYNAGEQFSEKMHQKDLEADAARGELSAVESEIAESESNEAVLKANLGHNKENIDRIDEEIKNQEGQNSGLSSQISERAARVESIDKESAEANARLALIGVQSEELTRSESENQQKIIELTQQAQEIALKLSDGKAELSSVAASMQEIEDREGSLLSDIQEETDRLSLTREEATAHKTELQKKEENVQSLKNVLAGYSMRAESGRRKLEDTREKATRLEMDYNALKSRIQLLSDMEKDYEGYSRAVKVVMRESSRGTLRGIMGPAGELLKTPDKYALAIETAMGAAMQNIIVATENDGKSAINMLKRLDGGRVTFLPMNVIRGNRINEPSLEREEGFEGIASDLVSFDSKYKDVYLNLLGRTVIVEDMDCAIQIARRFNHRYRLVTLDGQVINAGGSMTGGSISKNTGILSRANELKALSEREGTLKNELVELNAALEKAKRDVAAAEYEAKVAQDELFEAHRTLTKLQSEQEHYELLIDSYEEHLEQLKAERATSRSRAESMKQRADLVKALIAKLEAEDKAISSELNGETGGRDALSEKRLALMNEEAEVKAMLASLSAERETQLNAINELNILRSGIVTSREKQEETLEGLRHQSEEIVREIAKCEALISQKRAKAETLKERLRRINEEKLNIEAERTRSDKETQDKNRQLLDLERMSARIEQRMQAAEMEEKQIIDRLWDNYELTRTSAIAQRIELDNIQQAKRRTAELRKAMSALGTPNLGAIEEFERVNTRYTYLTDQRDDIDKSRKELLGIIGDITAEMQDIFSTEFKRINESFKETFLELFGGGRASLELEDEENILDCGIEIKVQPPGKTLKTITLLSGGEKAFVAIALYYAILKVRPTPFVIMDEIEAALDEANVVRTSNYMRRLCDKTQFLVITHRRGTMEEADVLFGVTMQEQGVSKVLMMDLDEAEKTIAKD